MSKIKLELDTIKDNSDGTYTLEFFYDTDEEEELKKIMKIYKDELYTGIKFFKIILNQGVMIFKTPATSTPKEVVNTKVNDILKRDLFALVNGQSDDVWINKLCALKIKYISKKKFSVNDLFGKSDDC
jgi:hypothetical protein